VSSRPARMLRHHQSPLAPPPPKLPPPPEKPPPPPPPPLHPPPPPPPQPHGTMTGADESRSRPAVNPRCSTKRRERIASMPRITAMTAISAPKPTIGQGCCFCFAELLPAPGPASILA